MTGTFSIGGFVMVLVENLAGPLAVTARRTVSISDGVRCYFASPLQKAEGFWGLRQGSLAVFMRIISQTSQA
jgi:hypothetical protein